MKLIDAEALKKALEVTQYDDIDDLTRTERLIDNAPTVWHPFTEEPTEEGQYLVQNYYKSWGGQIIITFDVVAFEDLVMMVRFEKKYGNRDNHYQAWQKIEPYEEDRE